jgi:hypothetical protein
MNTDSVRLVGAFLRYWTSEWLSAGMKGLSCHVAGQRLEASGGLGDIDWYGIGGPEERR